MDATHVLVGLHDGDLGIVSLGARGIDGRLTLGDSPTQLAMDANRLGELIVEVSDHRLELGEPRAEARADALRSRRPHHR